MRNPQRVSGLDASFVSLETASQHLQIFSILELDPSTVPGGYSFEAFRDALAVRLRAIPELREKIVDTALNLDFPVWTEDAEFDIARHVHRIGLPAPGTAQSSSGCADTSPVCGSTTACRCGSCGSSRASPAAAWP